MAKDVYDDFDICMLDLENDIKNKVKPRVAQEMKEIQKDAIEEVVYNPYTSSIVRRGEKEGLKDESNMDIDIDEGKDYLDITLTNVTKGNSKYSYMQGYTQGYISQIIETGKGYGYGLDSTIGARPFNEKTQEIIDSTNRIDKIVEDALNDW